MENTVLRPLNSGSSTSFKNPFAKKLNATSNLNGSENATLTDPFKKKLNFDKFRENLNKTEKATAANTENEAETVAEIVEETIVANTETVETATEGVVEAAEVETTDEVIETVTDVNEVATIVEETEGESDTNNEDSGASVVDSISENNTDILPEENNVEAEATPKKKRTRRTKAEMQKDAAAVNTSIETNTVNESINVATAVRNNSTVSFEDAIKEFESFSADSEWLAFKEDIMKAYSNINITPDINSAMLVVVINQLSELRDRIWVQHQYYKTQYDSLSSKEPEGIIERIKRINVNENANNDMQRKKSGIQACMNFKNDAGEIINLYDLLDEVRARYYFLNSIMSNIDFKKNLLITISSALKIENNLT